jgi:excisionase family DNA binding protein
MTLDVNATYMSSPQAAKILRITYVGVAQLARQGKIPAVKIANRWLIPRAFVEEFAQTYEGKRGRPRKKGPCTECPETPASAIRPDQLGLADTSATSEVGHSRHEAGELFALSAQADHQEEIPASITQPGELGQRETGAVSEDKVCKLEAEATLAMNAQVDHLEEPPASITQPGELELRDTSAVCETEDSKREGDGTFAVSAEVYHLDENYDFELYEKGQITERARLIVARLKPKIPSLPQFSFRWDYRYEHLNVDIHGVEPAVADWFMMGENGYTGHLPRRLGGPARAFEATIWLPVTFVFRGRLTLALRKNLATGEESPSEAPISGGLRKWWTKWPTAPPT